MVNKTKVYKRVLETWIHTIVSMIVMAVCMAVLIGITCRFGGAKVAVTIVMSTAGVGLAVFFLSEAIVTLLFRAEKPDKKKHFIFIQTIEELCKSRKMFFRPRLYILKMGTPNACAFGIGFFGQYAIGITEELYEMLDRDELKGVLAHELAHIRSKDVGLMTIITIITGGAEKLANLFLKGKTSLGKTFFASIIGWFLLFFAKFIFPVGRSAISKEREMSADALGALYQGTPDHLKSALIKLHSAYPRIEPTFIDELFISHPEIERRLKSLENLKH